MGTVGGWEWCDGLKLINNEFYVHGHDGIVCNYAGVEDKVADTSHFIGLKRYIGGYATDDEDSLSRDYLSDAPIPLNCGAATLFNVKRYEARCTVPDVMKQLALYPPDDRTDISYGGIWVAARIPTEEIPTPYHRAYRGGSDSVRRAGLFSLAVSINEKEDDSIVENETWYFRGFRIAYIPGIKQGKGWA